MDVLEFVMIVTEFVATFLLYFRIGGNTRHYCNQLEQ